MTRLNRMLPVATLLVTTPAALAAEGASGGLFDVNPGLSIWATIVFLALLGILWKFAWGPLLEQIDAREGRIQTAIDDSAEARAEARRLLEEHKAQLADARRQANELVTEGKIAGERLRREIEEKARIEAQRIVEGARLEIEREKDAALAELRDQSVDLALAAAAKLMGDRIDIVADREIIASYLDQVATAREVRA